MKRLLLLFILSPVILFGQMRPGAIADSIKANATDLKHVSELISNNKGTIVEHIQASDSGEYITMVVRVRVLEQVVMPFLPSLPIVEMKTGVIIACIVSTATIPPLPLPAIEGYAIDALPFLTVAQYRIEGIVARKAVAVSVPAFPDIQLETIDMLPLSLAMQFVIEEPPAGRMDTVAVPSFEERKMPVAGMHLSEEGYSLLEKLEGFSPTLYALKDGGLTIGFGFFVPYHEGRKWNKGMTWEEAERIMRQKVPQYEDQVKQYINVPLTQTEFDALTMIAYNLGGFSKATSIVNDINSEADFEKLQKDWMRFVHSKAPGVMKGLMNRRKDELNVRNASDYQHERKIQILKNIK